MIIEFSFMSLFHKFRLRFLLVFFFIKKCFSFNIFITYKYYCWTKYFIIVLLKCSY